jgi:FixJ family two-component response regulator
VHRARVMAKTGARSLAELVRIAQRAGGTGN